MSEDNDMQCPNCGLEIPGPPGKYNTCGHCRNKIVWRDGKPLKNPPLTDEPVVIEPLSPSTDETPEDFLAEDWELLKQEKKRGDREELERLVENAIGEEGEAEQKREEARREWEEAARKYRREEEEEKRKQEALRQKELHGLLKERDRIRDRINKEAAKADEFLFKIFLYFLLTISALFVAYYSISGWTMIGKELLKAWQTNTAKEWGAVCVASTIFVLLYLLFRNHYMGEERHRWDIVNNSEKDDVSRGAYYFGDPPKKDGNPPPVPKS